MVIAGVCLLLTSCNDFLDKLPDDRATLDNEEKISMLLTSAYGDRSNAFVHEYASDNVYYNGTTYSAQPNQEQVYKWIDVTSQGNDDPRGLWQGYYGAVGTANAALDALAEMGNPTSLNGQRAEALLCRAFAMFRLANVFCMAYDPSHPEYLGLPYTKTSGVAVGTRGTLNELYDNINADIEEALPLVSEAHLSVPKYHFNIRAAYAFAARFNLFYHKYDKAIEYATKAIGEDPTPMLRNWARFSPLGAVDLAHEFPKSGDPANLMIVAAYSIYGRSLYSSSYTRYAHNYSVISGYETLNAKTIWGSSGSSTALLLAAKQYGSTQQARFPRITEFFEYTDKVARTGYAHIVEVPFTSGETLLVRAEAYALKKDYKNAIKMVRQQHPNAVFFIFTDDKEWCKEHFKGPKFITVELQEGEFTDVADMLLMSRCKHHIIANSSFSWWSAWLNDSPEKIVIAPSKWINNKKMDDIYTERMTKVAI